MKAFINGLATGLFLQLAIGPVFFFIINLALQRSLSDALAGAAAVALVDLSYISLSVAGIGKVLEKGRTMKVFGIVSAAVLIVLGLMIVKGGGDSGIASLVVAHNSDLLSSFLTVLVLTVLNPMTIVVYTSMFASKAIEHGYRKNELWVFGVGTAVATLLFMSGSAVFFSAVRETVPSTVIQLLNLIVGSLLIAYGVLRLMKAPGITQFKCIALQKMGRR